LDDENYNTRMESIDISPQSTLTESFQNKVLRKLGPAWATRLRCIVKRRGLPRWGNLRRVKPFSSNFGWDRGTPVDRYYVDRFFERHRAEITGDVLEIDRNIYTRRFGHDLQTVHSIDISPASEPTFLCDIAHCEEILPAEAYDCVLLPCTLQHFRDLERCLRNVLRLVRPGGVILANAAGLFRLDQVGLDFWRPTPDGWRDLLPRVWPGCTIEVESEGNCLAVVAINLGLALEELQPEELNQNDDRFPVVTHIYCRKPSKAAN
jgi:SAM-dependent methyltransferase